MKIWVAVKRVPDTAARIRPEATGQGVDASDVKFVLNPYDEFAVEEALKLREQSGEGEVNVISVGPAESLPVLRQALAMGADRAVLLEAESPTGLELDNSQVSHALASYLRAQSPDLVLLGRIAVDLQSGAMAAQLARRLDIPRVCDVTSLELSGGKFRAQRLVRGEVEIVEAAPPLVLSAQKGLNEPRYPALKGILAAKKKPIETVPAELGEIRLELVKVTPPTERQPGKIVGEGAEAVPELLRLLQEEAKVL